MTLLGIDLGTTAVKALLMNEAGETLASVGQPCQAMWFVARGLVDVQFALAMVHSLGMPGPILRATDGFPFPV